MDPFVNESGNSHSLEFAKRVTRDVVRPFVIEHMNGQYGDPDARNAVTIVLCGLAKAMVPSLVGMSQTDRADLLEVLSAIVLDDCAEFEAQRAAQVKH